MLFRSPILHERGICPKPQREEGASANRGDIFVFFHGVSFQE